MSEKPSENIIKPILEEGFNIVELFLILIAFLGLILLKPVLEPLTIFQNIDRDINKDLLYFIPIPIIILIMIATIGGQTVKKKYDPNKLVIWTAINVAAVLAVQVIPIIIQHLVVQSASFYVTLLFECSAIAEETFYRLFIVALLQYMIIWVTKKDDKTFIIAVGVILSVIGGFLFMLSHTNYYSDSLLMGITFTTGLVQGILLVFHRQILISFIAHAVINLFAVQSVLQSLSSIMIICNSTILTNSFIIVIMIITNLLVGSIPFFVNKIRFGSWLK
jgi:membrane protease YdiL (CAAX protease family)